MWHGASHKRPAKKAALRHPAARALHGPGRCSATAQCSPTLLLSAALSHCSTQPLCPPSGCPQPPSGFPNWQQWHAAPTSEATARPTDGAESATTVANVKHSSSHWLTTKPAMLEPKLRQSTCRQPRGGHCCGWGGHPRRLLPLTACPPAAAGTACCSAPALPTCIVARH